MKCLNVGKINDLVLTAHIAGDRIIREDGNHPANVEIGYDKRAYPGITDITDYVISVANHVYKKTIEEDQKKIEIEKPKRKKKEENINESSIEDISSIDD